MSTHHEAVVSCYNGTRWDYKRFWRSHRTLAMHFGYYGKGVHTHRGAMQQMNAALAARVRASREDRVLDAGCGLGGSSLWLAEHIGCQVTGVNITPFQIETARRAAAERGLDSLVRFEIEDYAHTPLADHAFTVVWGLESVVHAESKADVLAEAYRLLAPGGRLVLAEYVLRAEPTLTDQDKQVVAPWLEGSAMPSLLTAGQYARILERIGFERVEFGDWTPHVARSLGRLRRIVSGAQPLLSLAQKARIMSSVQCGSVRASYAQSQALRRGLWRYLVITAERPA